MAPTHLPFIITQVGVLSHVWSLLLHQATSQLPGRPQSALLPVPVCHWRHITLQSDSHASCQNPTQCEPAHPEFSADLPVNFIRHGSEILSTAENPPSQAAFATIWAAPSHRKAVPRTGCFVSAVTGMWNRISLVALQKPLRPGNFQELWVHLKKSW